MGKRLANLFRNAKEIFALELDQLFRIRNE